MMFSPYERIYNTPDLSVPATEAILQQIRLERILKRFGYLACCKRIDPPTNADVAPPLISLPKPTPPRLLRPFGAHEAFSGWQRSKNIQIPKPKVCPKVPKSGIPGAPINDPYLQHQKETIGGCKYGGVHLTQYGLQEEVQRPDLFKPFQPLKSPQRLPAIQREKVKEFEPKVQATDVYKHVKATKKGSTQTKKMHVKDCKKRKKKRTQEMEFMKWEASQEQYFDKSVTDLHNYVNNLGKTVHAGTSTGQRYREQIATQIKQSVQDRIDTFGEGGKMLTSTTQFHHIPVLEMEFDHDNVQTKHVCMK